MDQWPVNASSTCKLKIHKQRARPAPSPHKPPTPSPKQQTDVNLPTGTESGVLATIGGRYSGWSFYLKDGYVL